MKAASRLRLRPMRIERHFVIRFPRTAARRAIGAAMLLCAALAPVARADYAVLQSGQRVHITGMKPSVKRFA